MLATGVRLNLEQYRFRRVLGLLALALGENHERVRRRLDPRLGVDYERAAAFLFGDENAV